MKHHLLSITHKSLITSANIHRKATEAKLNLYQELQLSPVQLLGVHSIFKSSSVSVILSILDASSYKVCFANCCFKSCLYGDYFFINTGHLGEPGFDPLELECKSISQTLKLE